LTSNHEAVPKTALTITYPALSLLVTLFPLGLLQDFLEILTRITI